MRTIDPSRPCCSFTQHRQTPYRTDMTISHHVPTIKKDAGFALLLHEGKILVACDMGAWSSWLLTLSPVASGSMSEPVLHAGNSPHDLIRPTAASSRAMIPSAQGSGSGGRAQSVAGGEWPCRSIRMTRRAAPAKK
jgi:hypothetical protein